MYFCLSSGQLLRLSVKLLCCVVLLCCILGLTGSVVLRSGQLSDVIAKLQELLKGVDEVQILPGRYDTALLAAQVF